MKLTRLELYPIIVARETGFANEHVIVRLETDDGAVGWGEMSDLSHLPLYRFDVEHLAASLRDVVVGLDPRDMNLIERRLLALYPDEGHMYSRSGLVRQGLDLALHDLLGRVDGVPVHRLLGGAIRDRVPVCYPVFRLRSVEQVEAALDRVQAKLDEGFATIRVYVGSEPAADEAFLIGFADRFGGRIRIKSLDFSNLVGWREALSLTERYAAIADVMMVESVALRGDLEGLREYRQRGRLPVSEHVHGGLRATLRMAAMADAAGASVLLGTTQELNLGTAAVAHLGAVLPALTY